MAKKIEKNQLRERAKKLPEVTDEMYEKVDKEYRMLAKEFVKNQGLSPKSKEQYESMLRQFGWYIHKELDDKPLHKISKRDFINFLTYLKDERKMSSSAISTRKACISSLCNYIENIIVGEEGFEHYKLFRNFTRGLPPIAKNKVYEKVKVTYEEYQKMMKVLEEREDYLGMAWLATAFNVGARRAEIIQFKTEILSYDFPEDVYQIKSHKVRLKGQGEDGKVESYLLNREAIKYMKLWVEKRGYDHEYIFTTKYNGNYRQMSESWADYFCSRVLSEILGRRINPHLFKASCITYLLEQGVKLEIVSKFVAHHEDPSTTIKHYDLRDFEEEVDNIFNPNKKAMKDE